jgi:kynurenine formamidase
VSSLSRERAGTVRIVDLSQEIYQGMPVYAGHLKTVVFQHHSFDETASNFDSDFAYQSLGLMMCDHGPTHQRQRLPAGRTAEG